MSIFFAPDTDPALEGVAGATPRPRSQRAFPPVVEPARCLGALPEIVENAHALPVADTFSFVISSGVCFDSSPEPRTAGGGVVRVFGKTAVCKSILARGTPPPQSPVAAADVAIAALARCPSVAIEVACCTLHQHARSAQGLERIVSIWKCLAIAILGKRPEFVMPAPHASAPFGDADLPAASLAGMFPDSAGAAALARRCRAAAAAAALTQVFTQSSEMTLDEEPETPEVAAAGAAVDETLVNQFVTIRFADYSLYMLELFCLTLGFSLKEHFPYTEEVTRASSLRLVMGPDAEASAPYAQDFARLLTIGGIHSRSTIALMNGTVRIAPLSATRPPWIRYAMTARYPEAPGVHSPVMLVITPPTIPWLCIVAFGAHFGSLRSFIPREGAEAAISAAAAAFREEGDAVGAAAIEADAAAVRAATALSPAERAAAFERIASTAARGIAAGMTAAPLTGAEAMSQTPGTQMRDASPGALPNADGLLSTMSSVPSAPLHAAEALARARSRRENGNGASARTMNTYNSPGFAAGRF